jgi:intein/homing endonuclease
MTGDTKVRIAGFDDFSGEIAAFVDALMTKHDKDVVDLGNDSLVLNLAEDYYVVGVSNQEKTSWRRISQVSRHPANGGLVKICTRSGRSTTATLSHSFLMRTPTGIVPVEGSQLRVGDRIPVARYIPTVENPLESIMVGTLKRTTFMLDREFGWFIGAYLADGSFGSGSIGISKMEPSFEECIRKFGERYGCSVSVKQETRVSPWHKDGKEHIYQTKTINLFNQPLQKWMDANFGRGSYKKHIPAWVYGCSQEFIAGIVAGYMDGDGNIHVARNMIRAHSVSETLADDMIVLMAYCGIFAKKQLERRKREKANLFYVIQVQHKYAQHMLDTVHLQVPHKRKGLEQIAEFNKNKTDTTEYIDMVPELDTIVCSLGNILHVPEQVRYKCFQKNGISRETLHQYIKLFRSLLDIQRPHLSQMAYFEIDTRIKLMEQGANGDVVWDEIVELEYLPDPGTFVYDFTVPGNDSFMVDTGVLVHNTLDSFHSSGTAAAVKATSGVPRLKELLSVTKNIKTPALRIHFKPDIGTVVNPPESKGDAETDPTSAAKNRVLPLMHRFEMTSISDILEMSEIYWDPPGNNGLSTGIREDGRLLELYRIFQRVNPERCYSRSPWVLRMMLSREKMHQHGLTMLDVYTSIEKTHGDTIECIFSDDNADELIFRIRINEAKTKDIDIEDTVAALKAVEYNIVKNVVLKGIQGIKKGSIRTVEGKRYNPDTAGFDNVVEWIMDTDGTNLEAILANPNVDKTRTISNDVCEIYKTLGIEAARNALYNEIMEVIRESSINYRHISLLIDTITNRGSLMSVDRHGINRSDVGPLAKSSFEETINMLIDASVFSEYDRINGVSANIMLGQLPPCGTGDSDILLDEEMLAELVKKAPKKEIVPEEPELEIEEPCRPQDIAFHFEMPTSSRPMAKLPEPKITFT